MSCKTLECLLRTGSSSPELRGRMENLLARMQESPALDIELLRGADDFTQLYVNFCELSLGGEDTQETLGILRSLVQGELHKANQRVEKFDALSKIYAEGGRNDLAALIGENTKAGGYSTS